jgi:hypothetical protein
MRRPLAFLVRGRLAFAALAVLCTPRLAAAQTFEQIGVRAQGMGGAFVAVADDATATWWNPAGQASGPFFNGVFEYDRSRHPDETSGTGFAIGVPSFGASYYRIPMSHIRAVSSTDQAAADRQDQGVFSQFGATVGQSVGNHLVVASTLKLVRALGDTAGGLDIGALARVGGLRVGISVKNVNRPSFGSGQDALTATRLVRAGIAVVRAGRGGIDQFSLSFDADLTVAPTPSGDERHVAGGGELWMLKRRLGVRGGFSGNTVGTVRGAGSAGLSVAVRSGSYLDGFYTTGSDPLRKGWGADLRVTF